MRTRLQVALLSSVFVALLPSVCAYAAFPGTPATPTIYQVTVNLVELCTGSDGAGSCTAPVVLGSSTSQFDIASVGAGAVVGSYANVSNLPIGPTFTHIRVTIDPAIVISAIGTDTANGGPAPCSTSASGGGSVNAASRATFPLAAPQRATVFVPAIGTYTLGGRPSPVTEADFQTPGSNYYIKRPTGSVQITYNLTAPFKPVAGQQPKVTVKFNVTNAVGFMWSGVCEVFPEPPSVTITIQ
jgi:hypothetical protein